MNTDKATAALGYFFASGSEINIKRRQSIIQINQSSEHIYLIKKGVVSFFSYDDTGNTVIHYLYKHHELFPLNQLFGVAESEVGFSAFTDVTIQRRLFSDWLEFLEQRPETLPALLKQESTSYDRIITLNTIPAEKRMAKWLLTLSNRFGRRNDNHIDVNLPTTIQELADCVRLSRESAGKILKNLEQAGIVVIGRQRIIIYSDKLDSYLD